MEVERIIQALDRLVELQEKILRKLGDGYVSASSLSDEWIDALKVQQILGISRATLYRVRKDNGLVYRQIGSRSYYSAPEIFTLRDRFKK